jgi:threonine dehydrogenase-like Zn-dependent dehydrogenase
MRALVFVAPGQVEWSERPEPRLDGDAQAIVRPLVVALCDLDRALLAGATPFQGPFPLGHEAVAEVIEVGDDVTRVRPGDRVVVPFQISCGACQRCQQGLTGSCTAVPTGAMYGLPARGDWGGLLAETVHVPYADAMLLLPATRHEDATTFLTSTRKRLRHRV